MDWVKMFGLHTPPLEMIIRGSVVYLSLYLLLRVVLKRESGTTGVTDLLVIVLLADAAQNAMAGDYTSIGDGLILVATIIAWSFLLNFIAFHFPRAGRFIRPRPLPLVKDGRVIPRHMRRELITREELMSQLRQQGVADLSRVKLVYMEPDGQFSVVTRKEDQHQPMRHGAV